MAKTKMIKSAGGPYSKATLQQVGTAMGNPPPQLKSAPKTLTLDTTGYTPPPATGGYAPSYPGYGGYGGYGGGYGGYGGGGGGGGGYASEYPQQYGQQGAGMQSGRPQQQGGYQIQQELPRWLQKLTTWTY